MMMRSAPRGLDRLGHLKSVPLSTRHCAGLHRQVQPRFHDDRIGGLRCRVECRLADGGPHVEYIAAPQSPGRTRLVRTFRVDRKDPYLEHLRSHLYLGTRVQPGFGFPAATFVVMCGFPMFVSAVRTVEPRYLVHSLHVYLSRPAMPMQPTVFPSFERIRDVDRSDQAVLDPDGATISDMSASFQADQDGSQPTRTRCRRRLPLTSCGCAR